MFSPRFEFKYRIDAEQAAAIREMALFYLEPDAHSLEGAYAVNSLYFDTPSNDDLHEMDEGVALRSKVRLRCYYRAPRPPFFLELKQRFGSTILKTRADLTPADADRLMGGAAPVEAYRSGESTENLDKIREVIDSRAMEPRVWIHYERQAYSSSWGDGSRITFDRAVESQVIDPAHPLRPEPSCWSFPDFDERTVLELKFLGSAPGWMQRVAHQLSLDRVSVSKYGLAAFSLDRSPVIASPAVS